MYEHDTFFHTEYIRFFVFSSYQLVFYQKSITKMKQKVRREKLYILRRRNSKREEKKQHEFISYLKASFSYGRILMFQNFVHFENKKSSYKLVDPM